MGTFRNPDNGDVRAVPAALDKKFAARGFEKVSDQAPPKKTAAPKKTTAKKTAAPDSSTQS